MRFKRPSVIGLAVVALIVAAVPSAVAAGGPQNPYDTMGFGYPGAMRVDIEGTLAVVSYSDESAHHGVIDALVFYDLTVPGAPTIVGTYPTPDLAWGLHIEGSVLYELRNGTGLVVWDISDPANASTVATVTTPADMAMDVEGDTLYMGRWSPATLYSYDVTDPTSPVLLDSLSVPGWNLSAIDAAGSTVYVGCRNGGALTTVDATDPSDLSILDSESTEAIGLLARSGRVYVAGEAGEGLSVWDVTTPTDITREATLVNPYGGWCVALDGTKLYLGTGGPQFIVYDIGVPGAPVEQRRVPTGGQVYDIEIDGGYAYIAGMGSGALVAKLPTTVGVDVFQPIAGASRYDTAIRASQEAFPYGSRAVVITTGRRYPDALGGSALASLMYGPTLLTDPYVLQEGVFAEIRRLDPMWAYILGGESAVSGDVEDQLVTELGAEHVIRIEGASRYETAANIALAVHAEVGSIDTVFVASGANFPDALAASPLSAQQWAPILLTQQGALPAATVSAMATISPSKVIVLGGPMVVSDDVVAELEVLVGEGNVIRLWGANRYATAAAVAQYGFDHMSSSFDNVALATGENWADALSGGTLQGRQTSVMLLTSSAALSPDTSAKLLEHGGEIGRLRYLGGTTAVSQDVRDACESLLP